MFDVDRLTAGTLRHGVHVASLLPPGSRQTVHLNLVSSHDAVGALQLHASVRHVRWEGHATCCRLAKLLAAAAHKCALLSLACLFPSGVAPHPPHPACFMCSVSCPAFQVPADLFARHERLVFAATKALQPRQPLLNTLLR